MASHNGNRRRSQSRLNAVWLITCLLLAGALLFAANWEAGRQERVRMSFFRDRVADMAKISESTIAAELRQIDGSLLVLRSAYSANPRRFAANIELLRSGPLADRELLVVLVDRDGYLAYTDAPDVKPRLYLGDRKYFRFFADGGKDRLYVDEPSFGRVTRRHTLPLARPIYDRQGGFLGVVAVSVKQESLTRFPSGVQLSEDTAITIVNQGGAVVSRSHDLDRVQGTIIPPEMLAPMLKGTEGVFSSRVIPDGIERVIAYRHIHDEETPLIVYVETSPANVLREVSLQRIMLMWGAGFTSLVVMVLILVYLKGRKITAQLIDTLHRSREQEYETLTRTSLDGFLTADSAGRILDTNDTFCKMLGYTQEELLSQSVIDFEAVESPEQVAARIRTIMEAGSDRFQSRYRCKDGSIRDVEISAQYIKESGGRFFIFIRDITERKRATATLRHSEERFKAIASNTPDHILMQDRQLRYTLVVNPQLGLTEQDMLGKTDYDFLSSEEADKLTKVKRQVIETSEPLHFETSLISTEGEPEFFDGTYVPIYDAQGNVDGLIGYFRNITERKLAEEKLRRNEEILRLFVEHSPAAIAMFDHEMKYIVASRRFLSDYDLGEQNVIGRSHYEIFPEIPERWKEIHRRCLAGGTERAEEDPFPRATGTLDWIRWEIRPWYKRHDEIGGIILFSELITERKLAEEELRKYRGRLEALVKERTKELEEAQAALVNIVEDLNEKSVQLAQAMEQAQSADRLKSAFLATMSHELRTPLNSIIGFTGIVLQGMSGPLNEEQAKQLTMAKSSANHLLDLINDVLDISKIEAGQVQIARKSFDMRPVIEQALRTVLPLAAKKGLSLDSVIASDVGVMISDRRRVEQILINLVNNAIKFTERGNVRIECRINEGRLETCVRDTGIGIKAEDVGKLFIPFSQVDTGLARNHEGTGLGLSICGKLVEMLGGTIRVESEWGKGSAFTFTLPLS